MDLLSWITGILSAKSKKKSIAIKSDGSSFFPEYLNESRALLKEATALKKEKKFFQACDKLREAYSASGSEHLMIEERLRLPMYLQLAGENDEGWEELNRLYVKYTDPFSQPIILHQMEVFLRKEKNVSALNPVRVIAKSDNDSQQTISKSKNIKKWELQNLIIPEHMTDVLDGLKFTATMQFRTPLRVLLRHGELYTKNDGAQPQIAIELWEGSWGFKIKTFKELGLNIDEVSGDDVMASHIGLISEKDYLPFLISVRKIVELDETIETRIKMLKEKPLKGGWQIYVNKHGGINEIIKEFFPRFIDTIPKINNAIVEELSKQGVHTPNDITAASDKTLLNIKGVGKAKLKIIHDYCADIEVNRDTHRLDKVTR